MSNVIEFGKNAAQRLITPSALALTSLLSAHPSEAATLTFGKQSQDSAANILTLTDPLSGNALSFSTITNQENNFYSYYGSSDYALSESGFLTETETFLTPGFWQQIETDREALAVAGEEFSNSIIANMGTDADGNTTFQINAPDADAMSIHTPFRGQQVREGSNTYTVEGEMGQAVYTFKAFDVDDYSAVQVAADPRGHFDIGALINLGQAIEEGHARASENARMFTVNDSTTGALAELNAGIGFPMLSEGDWVTGTRAVIIDEFGQETEIDVTDFIMDVERMTELSVEAGGDGTIPTDYLVIAITENSDAVLEQINTALQQPSATLHFVADSAQGRRVTTNRIDFGTPFSNDVTLGQVQIANGVDYDLPLSPTFSARASVNFGEDQTVDHEITQCEFLQIDSGQIQNYDYYIGNLDGFSGPYPRDQEVIFATQDGTNNVIAVGAPYMWGINTEKAAHGAGAGIEWTMTGSFENVAISMTPEELRQLSTGCTADNGGTARTLHTPSDTFDFDDNNGSITTTTVTHDIAEVSNIPAIFAITSALSALCVAGGAFRRRRTPQASNDVNASFGVPTKNLE